MSATAKSRLPVHRLHDEEIERLLATGERAPELVELLGEDGYRELSQLSRQAAATRRRGAPTVYVLPGLMGTRIGTRGRLLDDVLWLDIVEVAAGHLTRLALPRGSRLRALGMMWLNALKLKLSLEVAGFDARSHPYDWRLGIEPLARQLNARMASDARRDVMLVGHSMGGLVARAALAGGGRRIRRIVQIGAPNGGSFAPVLALRGVYPTVRKLAALDLRHSAEDLARIVFRTLPSLHELLPEPRGSLPDLFDAGQWPADALRPDPKLLVASRDARRSWPAGDERCLNVIGIRQETITGLRRSGTQFEFEVSEDGDGTVPRALAELTGARAWYVAEKHGGLPNNGRVISAVVDLLRTGETQRLPSSLRHERGAEVRRVSEAALRRVAPQKVRWQALSADARRRLLEPVVSPEFRGGVPDGYRATPTERRRAPRPAERRRLELRIVHGSIVDANARAVVLGLFRNVDPTGPAAALDARLGGAIRELTLRRMFHGSLGQVYVLPTPHSALLAELAVFAGLGDFDEFGPEAQAYAGENVIRAFARSRIEDFATVLLGAGSGSSIAAALEGQLRGYLAGLRRADPDRVVRRITICEIDGRKFRALRAALARLVAAPGAEDFELVVDEEDSRPPRDGAAGRARASRPADPAYLLVSLQDEGRARYSCRASLLTAGAKAAVLSGTVSVDRSDLRELVGWIERSTLAPRELARAGDRLARVLLAASVHEGLAGMSTHALVVVHDREASQVPWEALRIGSAWPALEQGLSRRYTSEQLSVARWRERRIPGERLRVLLVVDPTEDLPGATAEGAALEPLLADRGAEVEVLAGAAATRDRLRGLLRAGRHDVLHFAGHGHFDPARPGESGLVCAGDQVLRGADLDGIGDLPALVFFNACEAARVRRRTRRPGGTARGTVSRPSTSLAEAFLVGGVANFLGTHWPVGDEAALAFSARLYPALLAGRTLGDAIRDARHAVQAIGSGDWADYVHYGNAAFVLPQIPLRAEFPRSNSQQGSPRPTKRR